MADANNYIPEDLQRNSGGPGGYPTAFNTPGIYNQRERLQTIQEGDQEPINVSRTQRSGLAIQTNEGQMGLSAIGTDIRTLEIPLPQEIQASAQ